MLKKLLLIAAVFSSAYASAQAASTKYAIDAYPIGGKEQLEQVLETQLTLPKTVVTSNFDADIDAYFDVDAEGKATNIKINGARNNVLRNEMTRIFRFLKFAKTQNVYGDPYVLNFKLTADKYNHFFKQQNKLNLKKPLPADSSYTVYTRADKSPQYYKNGDEGLAEMILSEMEYPKLAIEKSVEGTVVLEFVVETNGYITDLVVKQGVGTGCTQEAIRVIKLTRWQPAVLENKLVRYRTTYPITFSLRNVNKDNSSTQG
jgi:TonB family protein